MALERRELYSSPNGDRWFLSHDTGTGNVFIRHEANVPSGGHLTDIEIGTFLSGGRNPEHQALIRLIGLLVEGNPKPRGPKRFFVRRET
jgi:hypothetical protein